MVLLLFPPFLLWILKTCLICGEKLLAQGFAKLDVYNSCKSSLMSCSLSLSADELIDTDFSSGSPPACKYGSIASSGHCVQEEMVLRIPRRQYHVTIFSYVCVC